MSGTKAMAARKAPTKKEVTIESVANDNALLLGVKALVPHLKSGDGPYNIVKLMEALRASMSEEEYHQLKNDAGAFFAPYGVREVYAATWDSGLIGKLHAGAAVLGTVLAIAALAEITGRIADVESMQVLSWISSKILG